MDNYYSGFSRIIMNQQTKQFQKRNLYILTGIPVTFGGINHVKRLSNRKLESISSAYGTELN